MSENRVKTKAGMPKGSPRAVDAVTVQRGKRVNPMDTGWAENGWRPALRRRT